MGIDSLTELMVEKKRVRNQIGLQLCEPDLAVHFLQK